MNELGEHLYNPNTKELIDVNVVGSGDHGIATNILIIKDFKERFMPTIDEHINEANPSELSKIKDLKSVGWIFPETVRFIEKFQPNIKKWPLYDFYSKYSTLDSKKYDTVGDGVKKFGFILTRNNNVELADWGQDKKKQLADCINKIKEKPKYMDNEQIFDDIDVNIFDYTTKRKWTEKVKDILYEPFSVKSNVDTDEKEVRGRYYQSPFANTRGDLKAFQQRFTGDSYNPSLDFSFKTFLTLQEENQCDGLFGPVYHGTQKDFDNFDPGKSNYYGTIYFTDDPKFAHMFATGEGFAGETSKGNVFTACLNAKNPFKPQDEKHRLILVPAIKKAIENKYKDPVTGANFNISPTLNNPKTNQPVQTIEDAIEHILWRIENKSWRFVESKPIIDFIKKQGFDSIMTKERGASNIAVFDPKQIKILKKDQAQPSQER